MSKGDKVLGANIKRLREMRGKMSARQLAEAVGISVPFVYDIENGRTMPSVSTLSAIARFFNVTTDYLMGRDVSSTKKAPVLPGGQDEGGGDQQIVDVPVPRGFSNDIIRVPVYDDIESACAGYGYDRGCDESSVTEFLDIPVWLLGGRYSSEPGRRPFIVTVYGDSMEEANIPDGSRVLVNPAAEACDGDVILAELDGKRMIKWIYWDRNDDGGELRAASSRYPVRRFTREDIQLERFRCFGKVCQVLNKPTRGA